MEPHEPGIRIDIGVKGSLPIGRRLYAYFGSAQGCGGIEARLRHHLRLNTKPHWHLDYFRRHCELRGCWVGYGRRNLEHAWCEQVLALPEAEIAMPGFGASDCRCCTHLVSLPRRVAIRTIGAALMSADACGTVHYLSKQQLARMANPH